MGVLFLLINDLRRLSLDTLNMIVFLEVIYRFNVISVKSNFNNVLRNTRKNNLKYRNTKDHKQRDVTQSNTGSFTIFDLKLHYRARLRKQHDPHRQWNRMENPEKNTHSYSYY